MKTITLNNLDTLPYATEEALNRLRINFNFCGDRFKKILITSSVPGEGKSFISTNLWRMLGESGRNVVLVDADIRKSMMRTRYRMNCSGGDLVGLSHYLAGSASLDDVVYATNLPGAYLLPTAHTVFNPSILLQNGRVEEMLDALAQRFDHVLVDTPPLTNVADGELIASYCDGALLVVHGGGTPRNLVSNSMKLLNRAGCELMGVVLNRVREDGNPYYQKYSKYGYYYGDSDGSRKG